MARSEEKKRISESIEEVDQLLDDMAIVSQQMREGKRLHSDEELEEVVNNNMENLVVNITDEEMRDWFFKDEDPDNPEDGGGSEDADAGEGGGPDDNI